VSRIRRHRLVEAVWLGVLVAGLVLLASSTAAGAGIGVALIALGARFT
jgi:hypothetical protein